MAGESDWAGVDTRVQVGTLNVAPDAADSLTMRDETMTRMVGSGLEKGGLAPRGDGAALQLRSTVSAAAWRPGPVVWDLVLTVQWELVDTATDGVLYRTATVGVSGGPARKGRTTPSYRGVEMAMHDAVDRLLAREKLVETWSQRVGALPSQGRPIPMRACTVERELPRDFDALFHAVVTLVEAEGGGHGTGTLISPDGYVLTAAHVVDGGADRARLRSGVEVDFDVVRIDRAHDIALLKIAGRDLVCVPLSDHVPVGADVWAVGTPLDQVLSHSVSKGIVSAVRSFEDHELIQTDSAISPGNSGGPLVGIGGRLVGVVSFKAVAKGVEGLGFAVPAGTAVQRLSMVLGEVSAPEPEASAPRAAFEPVVDADDTERRFEIPPALLDDARGVQRRRLVSGIALAGVGAALSGGATVAWTQADSVTLIGSIPYRAADVTGLSLVGTGGWFIVRALRGKQQIKRVAQR